MSSSLIWLDKDTKSLASFFFSAPVLLRATRSESVLKVLKSGSGAAHRGFDRQDEMASPGRIAEQGLPQVELQFFDVPCRLEFLLGLQHREFGHVAKIHGEKTLGLVRLGTSGRGGCRIFVGLAVRSQLFFGFRVVALFRSLRNSTADSASASAALATSASGKESSPRSGSTEARVSATTSRSGLPACTNSGSIGGSAAKSMSTPVSFAGRGNAASTAAQALRVVQAYAAVPLGMVGSSWCSSSWLQLYA
jgi:hypothetical protein